MGSQRRGRRRTIAEINVVPYIDVMLVLLVIFMATAPLLTQGVHVDLPEAVANPLDATETLPVVVSVDKRGALYLNISDNPDKALSPQVIQGEVAAALIRDPKRAVLVKGDKRVDYSTVLQAMVLLQQAGAPTIGLQTSQPSES